MVVPQEFVCLFRDFIWWPAVVLSAFDHDERFPAFWAGEPEMIWVTLLFELRIMPKPWLGSRCSSAVSMLPLGVWLTAALTAAFSDHSRDVSSR